MSTRNPAEVTGYSVALPADAARHGGPVWFSGGKLAADLTWPKLRRRWRSGTPPRPPLPGKRPSSCTLRVATFTCFTDCARSDVACLLR